MINVVRTYPNLFKLDSKDGTRIWFMEVGTNGLTGFHRSVSGLIDGEKVTSEWKFTETKNTGKANATTSIEQAHLEVESLYRKNIRKGYFENIDSIEDKVFKPMLAEGYDKSLVSYPVLAQPKLDGIRCIARKNGLWSRSNKQHIGTPHIETQLKDFFEQNPDIVFDGEFYNHQLRDDFNTITSFVRKSKPTEDDLKQSAETIQYHIYDIVDTKLTGRQRQQKISDLFDQYGDNWPSIIHVSTKIVDNETMLNRLYEKWLEDGYEGQMVRNDVVYETKRTKNLLKRKEFLTAEFKVEQMLEGSGNWNGCTKHFMLSDPVIGIFKSGVRGKREDLKALWQSQKTPDWVTLRYFTPTPDGIPRFPVAIDWGHGKRED